MAKMNWDRVNRERNLPDYSERFEAAEARLREGAAQRLRDRSAARSGSTSSATTSSTAGPNTGTAAKKSRKKKQKTAVGPTPVQNRPGRSGLGIVSPPNKKPKRKKRSATAQTFDSSSLQLHRIGGLVRSGQRTIRQLERQDANARRRHDGTQKPKTRAERETALAQKRAREQAAAAKANISVEELREQRRAKAREDQLLADEAKSMGLTTKQLRAQRAAQHNVDGTRP